MTHIASVGSMNGTIVKQTAHRHGRAQETGCVQYLGEGRIPVLTNLIPPPGRGPEKQAGDENAGKPECHVGLTGKRACQRGNAIIRTQRRLDTRTQAFRFPWPERARNRLDDRLIGDLKSEVIHDVGKDVGQIGNVDHVVVDIERVVLAFSFASEPMPPADLSSSINVLTNNNNAASGTPTISRRFSFRSGLLRT